MKLGPGHDGKIIGYEIEATYDDVRRVISTKAWDTYYNVGRQRELWRVVRTFTEEDDAVIADGAQAARADILGFDAEKWKREYRAEV